MTSRGTALVARLAACFLLTLGLVASAHAAGRFLAKWGSEGSGDGQFDEPSGVAVGPSGKVYVLDVGNDRVQKFTSTGTFIAKWGSEGTGDGQFWTPQCIAVDASEDVYVSDDSDDVQRFASDGAFLARWGTSGSGDGRFKLPQGMAVDASGDVYVADRVLDRVQRFTSTGVFIAKWGTTGSGNGEFDSPCGVAMDASGSIYVADQGNDRIQKFTSTGAFLTKWGSQGDDDGQFRYPKGVALDASGRVYVADAIYPGIHVFTSDGVFLARWGGSWSSDDGQFQWPEDVAVDADGSVYVADTLNHRIQKFAPPLSLRWAGISGYMNDGVKPNSGPPGTTFTFKVRYTDFLLAAPRKARCLLYRRIGRAWKLDTNLPMAKASGGLGTGAIYRASETLGNEVWKYRFHFQAGDGTWVAGDTPCAWQQGPEISGAPKLHWCGKPGYTADGVHPNKGPTGTRFTFKVMCQDSDGTVPDIRQVVIRRNGAQYKVKKMVAGGGDHRLGKIYAASVSLTEAGTYAYRFRFFEAGQQATGAPASWTSGPNITESGALAVSGLSSMPTNAGAQLTFTLSSAAQVEARVLNVAGRPVRTICSGRDCEAGANTLLWNAMGDRGVRVPKGVYLVEVAARAENGGQTRALTQVRIRG